MKSTKASSERSHVPSTPANVRKEVLPNGLTVVTEAMPTVRSVAMGIWLRGGSRQETKAENGITHFLEHMVFKGTTRRTAEEIARTADSIGGHLDAFTAKEFTSFSIKVLDEHVSRAFDVLGDLVRNPLLREDHVAKESKVIQEEIKMVEDTPDDLVHEIFLESYWRGHSLGRPILGTRRTVGSFDRARLLEYFHRHYNPKNMIVAAAGHLHHQRIVDLAAREFGDMPAGRPIPRDHAPVPHPVIGTHHKKNLEQAHICLATPAYPHTHKKRYASYVLNTVLGGGMSSRLFQKIREERGLVYAVFSGLSTFRDVGYLSVYAGTSSQNVRQVVDLIVAEFKELKSKLLAADELQRAKNYLKGSMLLGLESTGSRMGNVARQEIYFGTYTTLDEIGRRIDGVTADRVLEVAREIFAVKQLALTVLGPPHGLKFTRAHLAC
jgi:predicted Zn-dependent peptidase